MSAAVFYAFANKIDVESGEDLYLEAEEAELRIKQELTEVEFTRK